MSTPLSAVTGSFAPGLFRDRQVLAQQCCTEQTCGRSYPSPARGSGDADGDRACQLQHAVEGMDSHIHLGRPTLVRARAHPPPVSHVLRTRNLDRLRPSPITCLNLPMAASAQARFV